MDLVHHLDSESFRPFIESKDVVLVLVPVLPFSERSQTLVPIFEKVAHIVKDTNISFAQINFMDNGEVLLPYDLYLGGTPYILLLQGLDKFRKYHGAFKESDLVAYINRFLELPVMSTVSESSLPEFKKQNDAVVVGYIATEDKDSQDQFQSLAEAMHPEFVFGISNDLELAKSEGIDVPGVAVYRAKDAEMATLTLTNDTDQRMGALRKVGRPLIIDLEFNTHNNFLDMEIPFGYVFANTLEERSELRKEIEPLAREYRQDLQFALADPVDLAHIVENLHLDVTDYPAFAILEPIANLRYPMNKTSSPVFIEALDSFLQEFLSDDLQPTIKSEPLPQEASKEALVKIVGLNFRDIVMDGSIDVLVMFNIAQCGPCDYLQPILEALAELYATDLKLKDQVRIGKVMYDANDTPERGIRGFPTFMLYPAASKSSPKMFLGEEDTLMNFANFVRDKGTFHADLQISEEQKTALQETLSLEQICGSENGVVQ